MILEKSVQEVLEVVKIEDVIQDYVQLRRRGTNLIGLCPFHQEKTPSFNVSPSRNIFKCFGCGKGGNAVQFLMEHDQMSFPEAIRHLASRYGIALEETAVSTEVFEQRQLLDSLYLINEFARDFFQKQLFETDKGKSIGLKYFKDRGFREETIRKFNLGYAPDAPDEFTALALKAGYSADQLKELGLTTQYDRDFFRGRVMFTIHNQSGKVIGFAGRLLAKDVKAPKYINTPETPLYHKSKVLYGAYFAKRAIRQEDQCILVEGYTDVITLHQAGIENVVAASGTSLTEDQIRLIKRHTPNVKFIFDGDLAGTKAALRGLDMVLAQDLNVSIVMLPQGEDPDSYLQQVGVQAFKTFIDQQAQDFILFKARLLLEDSAGDPVKKAYAIKDIIGTVARVPDPLKRSLFLKECAGLFQVDEQLLVNETNKLLGQQLRKHQEQTAEALEPGAGEGGGTEGGLGELTPQQPREAEKPIGDVFQERDIIRVLINGGDQWFDKEKTITVAQFIIGNIEDVLEEFDHGLYQRIARECRQLLLEKREVKSAHFLQHPDPEIQKLAVDLVSSPYEYSENWEKRWDIRLNTQKDPDKNFHEDAMRSLGRFRLRKIDRMILKNREKVEEAFKQNSEEYMIYIKVDQHLKRMRNDLAKNLGTVVLR